MNLATEIRPELWDAISKPYEAKMYSSAVLEAFHCLSNVLRERANVDGDGASLVGQALGADSPRLRINKFETETEKNEQKGLEQILRGLYLGIRNPRSHEQHVDTQPTADAVILFIDYVLGIVCQAKEPFTLDEWVERVFDPSFVASDRYAALLASEVPTKKRSDALITVYRRKRSGDGKNLRFIFAAFAGILSEDQFSDFLGIVSDELKVIQDDSNIQTILQILPSKLWPRIDEIARLRIENKLILSIGSRSYDPKRPNSGPGWLGTWAQGYVGHFTLKKELLSVLLQKLRTKDVREHNYVSEYFVGSLADAIDESWSVSSKAYYRTAFVKAIGEAVLNPNGSKLLHDEVPSLFYLVPIDWHEPLLAGLKPLEATDPEYYKTLVEARNIANNDLI
jgi:uncharacterized protein (TIGR02391 family)